MARTIISLAVAAIFTWMPALFLSSSAVACESVDSSLGVDRNVDALKWQISPQPDQDWFASTANRAPLNQETLRELVSLDCRVSDRLLSLEDRIIKRMNAVASYSVVPDQPVPKKIAAIFPETESTTAQWPMATILGPLPGHFQTQVGSWEMAWYHLNLNGGINTSDIVIQPLILPIESAEAERLFGMARDNLTEDESVPPLSLFFSSMIAYRPAIDWLRISRWLEVRRTDFELWSNHVASITQRWLKQDQPIGNDWVSQLAASQSIKRFVRVRNEWVIWKPRNRQLVQQQAVSQRLLNQTAATASQQSLQDDDWCRSNTILFNLPARADAAATSGLTTKPSEAAKEASVGLNRIRLPLGSSDDEPQVDSDKDPYWEYYNDCDYWNVSFAGVDSPAEPAELGELMTSADQQTGAFGWKALIDLLQPYVSQVESRLWLDSNATNARLD